MRQYGFHFHGNSRLRYAAYARNHGMSPEQIRTLDRELCPTALLLPYVAWLNRKWYDWDVLNPGRPEHGPAEHRDFDRWIEQLTPSLNAITCECHIKLSRPIH